MTNKNMISADKAHETRSSSRKRENATGNEAAPDSPQLSPQIDEKRTRLQNPHIDDPSGGTTPDGERSG
jgi:hypothetical protein